MHKGLEVKQYLVKANSQKWPREGEEVGERRELCQDEAGHRQHPAEEDPRSEAQQHQ